MQPTSPFSLLVGVILPYLAIAVFLGGTLYRLLTWRRLPQPGVMTLYPTQGSGIIPLAKEALLFPSLYRGDRPLWVMAWAFHVMLALAFIGHFRAITSLADRVLAGLGVSPGGVVALSSVAGGVAGIILLTALVLLLARRLFLARARQISKVPDFGALLLLLAVVATGDLLRFSGSAIDLSETRAWASSLLSFSPIVPTTPGLLLHLLLAEALVLYLAFSKLMHFGGFFFTFSLVKRSQP